VCVCGLVVRSLDRLAGPLSHLDLRTWSPARTVVVKIDDAISHYLVAWQGCGLSTRNVAVQAPSPETSATFT